MTSPVTVDLDSAKVVEIFPQQRINPTYFAEFGEKVPERPKKGSTLFMLHLPDSTTTSATPEPSAPTPEPPAPVEEPKRKKKSKKNQSSSDEESIEAIITEEQQHQAPKKRRRTEKPAPENHWKLYMKATQDGVAGKKGTLIEAQKIPSGTIVHLVKGPKYIQTLMYYEGVWQNLK